MVIDDNTNQSKYEV
jgi:hypothetical protein